MELWDLKETAVDAGTRINLVNRLEQITERRLGEDSLLR
jgi:hypothetical protein